MSIKQINGNLSDLEERAIAALWCLGISYGVGGDAWFSGPAIGAVLGGKWTSYRRGVLQRLADRGYVDIYLRDEAAVKFVYRLTPDAWEGYTKKLQMASVVGTYIIRV